jgi:hypothetical protein
MVLSKKIKTALDETRLLILSAQVLFGFHFNAAFQDAFDDLQLPLRLIACAGLVLIMIAIGLLIAPSMQHRIVERGEDTHRIHRATTVLAGWALLPLATALGLDTFLAMDRSFGPDVAVLAGALCFILAIALWYVLEILIKESGAMQKEDEERAPLSAKVEQMLTEARVIIPGAQALLGFQLTVTLTRAFERLPFESKLAHAMALGCIALSIILLMAPAALHRISFNGEDSPKFLRIGSVFVISAPLPLALGIAFDIYVATVSALESNLLAEIIAVVTIIALTLLWYAYPIWRRLHPAA